MVAINDYLKSIAKCVEHMFYSLPILTPLFQIPKINISFQHLSNDRLKTK